MDTLKMSKYGSVLTGREFGKDAMEKIKLKLTHPTCLDFEGVISLGSSFADEVLVPIAKGQNNTISVINVTAPIWACIQDVAKDAGIKVSKS